MNKIIYVCDDYIFKHHLSSILIIFGITLLIIIITILLVKKEFKNDK